MDEECGHGGVRVVSVQNTDMEPPVQELQAMEDETEDSVGRGTRSHGEREEPLHDPRPPCRRTCTHSVLDVLRTTKVGSRVGPQAVLPKPGEDRTAGVGRGEDEELEGEEEEE